MDGLGATVVEEIDSALMLHGSIVHVLVDGSPTAHALVEPMEVLENPARDKDVAHPAALIAQRLGEFSPLLVIAGPEKRRFWTVARSSYRNDRR